MILSTANNGKNGMGKSPINLSNCPFDLRSGDYLISCFINKFDID